MLASGSARNLGGPVVSSIDRDGRPVERVQAGGNVALHPPPERMSERSWYR